MMRFYNPLYTRTWAKIFVPVTTFFIQLGQQVGLNTFSGNNDSHDDVTIKNSLTSNGQISKSSSSSYDDHPSLSQPSSLSPLSNFFSTLTSPFRPRAPSSTSSAGNRPRRPHYKTAIYRQRSQNGGVEFSDTDSIYHQLHIHTVNDENNNAFIATAGNNNNKNKNNTSNGVIIHMPTSVSSSSHVSLTDDDDDHGDKPLLPLTTQSITKSSSFAFGHYTREHLIWIATLSIFYFAWFTLIVGIGPLHIIIYLVIIVCYFISDRSRRLILALFIYLAYLFLYDSMRVLPNHAVSNIHTEDVYTLEKKLFGIYSNGQLVTLNEYFQKHHTPILDVLSGCFYLNWIPIPLSYSLYLYRYKGKREYMDFAFTFLLTNITGFIIYYIIPTAPPWYIELYGFEINRKAPGSPAGFIFFDQITGIKIFSSMYSKNANVFAAIPSLHAAYPVLTVLYGSLSKRLWLHIAFGFFTLSIWFSAVYSRHHYVLDVLLGGMCTVTAYFIYRLLSRIPTINRLLVAYSKVI